jgi:hypothetical protein
MARQNLHYFQICYEIIFKITFTLKTIPSGRPIYVVFGFIEYLLHFNNKFNSNTAIIVTVLWKHKRARGLCGGLNE